MFEKDATKCTGVNIIGLCGWWKMWMIPDFSLIRWIFLASSLEALQRVQNAAARLVFGLSRLEHVTPSLIQRHWLPVSYRLKFNLCCLIHAIRSRSGL